MRHNALSREMYRLAIYQLTGRGEGISMEDLKLMDDKTLSGTFNYWSNLKTQNSRREIK